MTLVDRGRSFAAVMVGAACLFSVLLLWAPVADAAPPNDDFANAQALGASLPQDEFGSNSLATKQAGEPNHAGDPGGHSVWFSWTPSSSGRVDVAACGFGLDTVLAVYTGSSVEDLTPIASSDEGLALACSSGDGEVEFEAAAGTMYRIAVDGRGETEGLFRLKIQGPPANDNFDVPETLLSGLPSQAGGTTSFASKEPGEPNHAGVAGGRSTWYSWTPSSSGPVDVAVCGFEGVDTLLAVYTGSAVDNLAEVASNDDGQECSGSGGSEAQFTAVAGTTYRIAVDGKDQRQGSFQLRLTGPATNDDFADAQAIPSGSTSVGGSTKFATKEPGEPDHAGNPGGHSVWFSWTASDNGPIGFSTTSSCSSNLDTLLAVYSGAAVNDLTPVASNDNKGTDCNPSDSELEFVAVAGTTYLIAVDGKGSGEGDFSLQVQKGPDNDDFSSAQALAPDLPHFLPGTTKLATKQAGEPNHAGDPGGHSVWYSWTPSSSGRVGISSTSCFGLGADTVLAVYTGASVNALTPVAGNQIRLTHFCSGGEVQFTAAAGTTYRIAVDGRNGEQGSFQLGSTPAPANDDLANAAEIASDLPQSATGSTKLATKQPDEPDHAADPGGHSVWYTWTPTVSGPVDIISTDSCGGSGLDTLLAVYTGSAIDNLTPIASNDDGSPSPCNRGDSEVEFTAAAGTTYRIAVDSAGSVVGSFSLSLVSRPQNDDFASATPVGLSTAAGATNRIATKEPGEPDHAGVPGGHSVWFSWTPTSGGTVEVSLCSGSDGGFDAVLAIYTGSTVDNLTQVASSDEDGGLCATATDVEFTAIAGTTYHFAVDGRDGSEGRFSLGLDGRPPNDDFSKAQAVGSGLPALTSGTTRLATKEPGEPDHGGDPGGHSVWYRWTPSSSGTVDLSTCFFGESRNTVVAVYTGAAVDNLTPVASIDTGPECGESGGRDLRFTAIAGTTYRIAVDTRGASQEGFLLSLHGPPTNDLFAKAGKVTDSISSFAGGDNSLAAREPGEPNHADDPGGHSVWFSWTAIDSGPAEISSCSRNGGLDTLLAVYTGSAIDNLTPVASNDDAASPKCSATDSEVQFTATAGTIYRIAVDGKGGTEGGFTLGLTRRPVNDDFANPRALEADLPASGGSSTLFATAEGGEPDHAGNPGGHSVWFSWTPTSSHPVDISICSSPEDGLDTLLAVYTGSAIDNLTPVASNDDAASPDCSATDSETQFMATAGTTYRIAVDHKGAGTGSFGLNLSGAERNDDFAMAQTLGSGSSRSEIGSNRLATKQASEPDHAGGAGGASVWFKWTAPRSAPVRIDTCGSNLDTLLAAYTGSSLANLTPVASNDDDVSGDGCGSGDSNIEFVASAGTTYRIAVDGANGDNGHFKFELRSSASPRLLTIDRAGAGTVRSIPAGIECGSICSRIFERGTQVTLTAMSSPGSTFAGWSGGGCGGTGECRVTLNANTTVSAKFEPLPGGVAPPSGATPPATPPPPKPLRCRPGFKKVRVHGKARCVKKRKRHRRHHH